MYRKDIVYIRLYSQIGNIIHVLVASPSCHRCVCAIRYLCGMVYVLSVYPIK